MWPRCRLRRVEVVAHELRVHTPGVGFAITLDPAMIPSVCAALAPAFSPNTP